MAQQNTDGARSLSPDIVPLSSTPQTDTVEVDIDEASPSRSTPKLPEPIPSTEHAVYLGLNPAQVRQLVIASAPSAIRPLLEQEQDLTPYLEVDIFDPDASNKTFKEILDCLQNPENCKSNPLQPGNKVQTHGQAEAQTSPNPAATASIQTQEITAPSATHWVVKVPKAPVQKFNRMFMGKASVAEVTNPLKFLQDFLTQIAKKENPNRPEPVIKLAPVLAISYQIPNLPASFPIIIQKQLEPIPNKPEYNTQLEAIARQFLSIAKTLWFKYGILIDPLGYEGIKRWLRNTPETNEPTTKESPTVQATQLNGSPTDLRYLLTNFGLDPTTSEILAYDLISFVATGFRHPKASKRLIWMFMEQSQIALLKKILNGTTIPAHLQAQMALGAPIDFLKGLKNKSKRKK